jgi:hypothetical protein
MSRPRMRPAEAPVSMKMHIADEPGPLHLWGMTEAWRLGENWQADFWPFCSRHRYLRLSGVTTYRILLLRTVSKLRLTSGLGILYPDIQGRMISSRVNLAEIHKR